MYIKKSGCNVGTTCQFTSDIRFTKRRINIQSLPRFFVNTSTLVATDGSENRLCGDEVKAGMHKNRPPSHLEHNIFLRQSLIFSVSV